MLQESQFTLLCTLITEKPENTSHRSWLLYSYIVCHVPMSYMMSFFKKCHYVWLKLHVKYECLPFQSPPKSIIQVCIQNIQVQGCIVPIMHSFYALHTKNTHSNARCLLFLWYFHAAPTKPWHDVIKNDWGGITGFLDFAHSLVF